MRSLLARYVAMFLGMLVALFTGLAQAAIDTSTIITDVAANQAELILLGLAILTCVYALRAFSWGRKI